MTAFLVGAAALALYYIEGRKALRTRREKREVRTGRNLAIAALAGAAMSAVEGPLLRRVARHVEQNQLGLAHSLTRNRPLRTVVAVILLDYGLYLWHVLTHRVPFLWRFHIVHHIDLDLDTSTALRFHFGEMLLSVPWRLLQVRVAGASVSAVMTWQTLLFLSILFHHSNVRLPLKYERWLRYLIATPRLHGIHHRAEESCLNSNWSSGLAVWDILHRTHCWREDEQLDTGVPGYTEAQQVTLMKCLKLPFTPSAFHPRSCLP